MASLTKSKNGSWRILVVCSDHKRRSIRLEKNTSKHDADSIKKYIEKLNAAKAGNYPIDLSTAEWLAGIQAKLRDRIVRAGLTSIAPPDPVIEKVTLGKYLDKFAQTHIDIKESTEIAISHTWKRLEEFFKRSTPLEDITPDRAREFKVWLKTTNKRDVRLMLANDKTQLPEGWANAQELSRLLVDPSKKRPTGARIEKILIKAKVQSRINEKRIREYPVAEALKKILAPKKLDDNTVRRRIGYCRQIFNQAIEDGIIVKNPFVLKALKASVKANETRKHHIEMDVFEKVLAAAPNARWRALLVLARVGAVRVPSEVKGLKWEHIAWDSKRITIHSPKTEHHEGMASRVIPLYPQIEAELLKLFAEAEDGGEYVFPGLPQVAIYALPLRKSFSGLV